MANPVQGSRGAIARTIRWFAPEHDSGGVLSVTFITTATVAQQIGAQGEELPRHQQVSTAQRWFAPEAEVEPVPRLPSAWAGGDIGREAQQDRSTAQRWFAPEAEVETPLPPTGAAFDPATGFPWQEQPQAWSDGSPRLQRDIDDVEGFPPLPNAYSGFDLEEQPAAWRDGTPWFRPDDANEIVPPLPNAAAHPDLGWDATFDRDRSQQWFAPEPYVESPLPLASPLSPLTAELLAGLWPDQSGQQDRSIQPVWFRPDDATEGVPPITPAFDPATGFDWTDESGQQDRAIQPTWRDPESDSAIGFLPSTATTATVDQMAPLWQEQPAHWFDPQRISDAIEPWSMAINPNLYAPAPGATPTVLINAENGDVFLYIGGNFIVPAS